MVIYFGDTFHNIRNSLAFSPRWKIYRALNKLFAYLHLRLVWLARIHSSVKIFAEHWRQASQFLVETTCSQLVSYRCDRALICTSTSSRENPFLYSINFVETLWTLLNRTLWSHPCVWCGASAVLDCSQLLVFTWRGATPRLAAGRYYGLPCRATLLYVPAVLYVWLTCTGYAKYFAILFYSHCNQNINKYVFT